MKYKHIEASREARLWIGQVIIPAMAVGLLMSSQLRDTVTDKAYDAKQSVKRWFDR